MEGLTEAVFYHFTFPCLKYLRFSLDLYVTKVKELQLAWVLFIEDLLYIHNL